MAARLHRSDRSGASGRGEEVGRGGLVQDQSGRPENDMSASPRLATKASWESLRGHERIKSYVNGIEEQDGRLTTD